MTEKGREQAEATTSDGERKRQHKENPVERFAEEVESHLIEGGEMATATTSAETNVVLAALGAIEGPQTHEPKREKKRNARKRNKARPETR
jgi:hypothetical protein